MRLVDSSALIGWLTGFDREESVLSHLLEGEEWLVPTIATCRAPPRTPPEWGGPRLARAIAEESGKNQTNAEGYRSIMPRGPVIPWAQPTSPAASEHGNQKCSYSTYCAKSDHDDDFDHEWLSPLD